MKFAEWLLSESSLKDLLKSTISAFPHTTRRQHATDTIKIVKLDWVPYLGLKTLFIKGLAQNEGREYNPIILFKNVIFNEGGVHLNDSNGKQHQVQPLSFDKNEVLVRCQCADFRWRFTHYDHEDASLYGRNRKKYEAKYNPGSANPEEMPGMCKHLIKMIKALRETKILS